MTSRTPATPQEDETLESPRLRLEPFAERHLTPEYVAWLNDPDVTRFSEQRFRSHTLDTCRAYVAGVAAGPGRLWAIVSKTDGTHIGNIAISVDPNHRVADVSILVGEKAVWGRGFGLEAWNLVLDFAFGRLKMRKVTAGTLACNHAMLSIMRRSGMTEEGRRIRQCLVEGEEVDVVYYGLFRSGS